MEWKDQTKISGNLEEFQLENNPWGGNSSSSTHSSAIKPTQSPSDGENKQIEAVSSDLSNMALESVQTQSIAPISPIPPKLVLSTTQKEIDLDIDEIFGSVDIKKPIVDSVDTPQRSRSPTRESNAESPTLRQKASNSSLNQESTRNSQDFKQRTAKDFRKSISKSEEKFTSKSHTLSSIQSLFTDSQKIAYVGLCYLSIMDFKKRLEPHKKALTSFGQWSDSFLEKLYVYLDLLAQERLMIENLALHGLVPSDLSVTLINDAKHAASSMKDLLDQEEEEEKSTNLSDIRYSVLSHLFLLSISDGHYDARARSMLRIIADYLEVPYLDVVQLETYIANELRLYEGPEEVKPDEKVVEGRNKAETRNRWLYAGAATLTGGVLIGLTAGLAAPLIGAGIGAALTTCGVTHGVAGVGAFMASTGGLALITSGGVLTGGGFYV